MSCGAVTTIRQQYLCCEFVIRVRCPEILDAIRPIRLGARQEFPVKHTVRFVIERTDRGIRIDEMNHGVSVAREADEVCQYLYRRAYEHMQTLMPDYVGLHAGCADRGSQRILFCGHKGSGKSTLAAHMVRSGFVVGGDETVVARNGLVTPVPRRIFLKPQTCRLLPVPMARWRRLPALRQDSGWARGYDPTEDGHEWYIFPARADWIVYIEGVSPDAPRTEPESEIGMIHKLMSQTYSCWSHTSRDDWISEVSRLVGQARCVRLYPGPPRDTALHLGSLLDAAGPMVYQA